MEGLHNINSSTHIRLDVQQVSTDITALVTHSIITTLIMTYEHSLIVMKHS